MKLQAISDYGSNVRLVSDDATEDQIDRIMRELDWQGFHQVVLEQRTGEYLEVSGSLDPTDGLSALYEENGTQHVTREAPASTEELRQLLQGYLAGGDGWKLLVEWG